MRWPGRRARGAGRSRLGISLGLEHPGLQGDPVERVGPRVGGERGAGAVEPAQLDQDIAEQGVGEAVAASRPFRDGEGLREPVLRRRRGPRITCTPAPPPCAIARRADSSARLASSSEPDLVVPGEVARASSAQPWATLPSRSARFLQNSTALVVARGSGGAFQPGPDVVARGVPPGCAGWPSAAAMNKGARNANISGSPLVMTCNDRGCGWRTPDESRWDGIRRRGFPGITGRGLRAARARRGRGRRRGSACALASTLSVVRAAISAPSSGARPRAGMVLPKTMPSERSATSSSRSRPPNRPPVTPPVSTPR